MQRSYEAVIEQGLIGLDRIDNIAGGLANEYERHVARHDERRDADSMLERRLDHRPKHRDRAGEHQRLDDQPQEADVVTPVTGRQLPHEQSPDDARVASALSPHRRALPVMPAILRLPPPMRSGSHEAVALAYSSQFFRHVAAVLRMRLRLRLQPGMTNALRRWRLLLGSAGAAVATQTSKTRLTVRVGRKL